MFSFRLGGSIPIIIYESRCVIRLNFLILITSRRNIKFTAFRVKKKWMRNGDIGKSAYRGYFYPSDTDGTKHVVQKCLIVNVLRVS